MGLFYVDFSPASCLSPLPLAVVIKNVYNLPMGRKLQSCRTGHGICPELLLDQKGGASFFEGFRDQMRREHRKSV